ncbi:unnamed protein product, partial [Ascophyllum nodosum]
SELFVPRRVSLEISRLEISRRKVLLLWTYCDIVVRGAICYFLNSHTRVFCLGTRSAGKCAIFRATMTSRQPRQVRTRGMEPPYGTDQISALILHPIISAVNNDVLYVLAYVEDIYIRVLLLLVSILNPYNL